MIAGHATSIRIESLFWDELIRAAADLGLPVNALVAEIDARRVLETETPNLASAIRQWLFMRALSESTTDQQVAPDTTSGATADGAPL